MKGPRELKRLMALIRKYDHKGNGVVPAYALDSMHLFKLERCKKWRKTHRRPRDGYQECCR